MATRNKVNPQDLLISNPNTSATSTSLYRAVGTEIYSKSNNISEKCMHHRHGVPSHLNRMMAMIILSYQECDYGTAAAPTSRYVRPDRGMSRTIERDDGRVIIQVAAVSKPWREKILKNSGRHKRR